ncbi:MAG TPA: BON domain-containing protein [Fibrella sp.]
MKFLRPGLILISAAILMSICGCRTTSNGASSGADSTPGGAGKTGNAANRSDQIKPAPTFTVSQALGVKILEALNADKNMKKHSISVGTSPGAVWLSGFVTDAKQKKLAEQIVRRQAPKTKVVNNLQIGKPPAPPKVPPGKVAARKE